MGSRLSKSLGPHYSFLGLPGPELDYASARSVIIPAPYDGTTTFRAGTREGPRAILSASREIELFDEETCTEAYKQGIFTLEEVPVNVGSPKEMVKAVRNG